ncbi:P-loop NTPase fold protein [Peribacillus sp. NJ11]|uniref:P-loop NTPase fold protein n=1 Tax=Peribacillus sp. NJ11 TaxID=3055861 RepID=UPI0025A24B01|nr:P-loop NTPase fold protein [Peribacillus sp. NJ11]MDM5222990.1 P-loop NTPase fold protein [Peribacillus sp. NJ11]
MSRVILQPTGSKDAREHYVDTLVRAVDIVRIKPYLTRDEFKHLQELYPSGLVPTWGVTGGVNSPNVNKWNKIHPADVAFFSANKVLYSYGFVTFKIHNKPLAEHLWGFNENGQTREYIYFLDEVREHDIPISLFNDIVGYSESYKVQGFTVLDEDKSYALLSFLQLPSATLIKPISGVFPNGEDGMTDEIAHKDLLGRDNLVKELSDFYIEYIQGKSSPIYFGIFARWGMGKSSVVEMITNIIRKRNSTENHYFVCKVDCSLMHKKDKLWISILKKLLDDLSVKDIKKNVFGSKFWSLKTKFFIKNLIAWSKRQWWLPSLVILSLSFFIYNFSKSSLPTMLLPKDFKEVLALISILTFLYTITKTILSLVKQNVFLFDDRNEESSYIKSVNEYKQLLTLINDIPKKKNLKILLVLDELDRIHKDLLPDIIELIQLFKGLNNELSTSEIDQNKSVISFLFSFNHDILFPIIGKSVTLNDKQLLVHSYRDYRGFVEGEQKDAYIDYYKLGKEFMDKYLDLSLYLEEKIDYTTLVQELFGGMGESEESAVNIEMQEALKKNHVSDQHGSVEIEQGDFRLDKEEQKLVSFTIHEMEVIKKTIKKYASNVEPRKIKRLKNALIMLKKLNKGNQIDKEDRLYEKELTEFIVKFLEVDFLKGQINTDVLSAEIAATNDNYFIDEENVYLKFTEYFINEKRKK